MGSMNISITEEVYSMLTTLKGENESFSEVIKSLVKKDITQCYGLLRDYKEELEIVEKEAIKARKEHWKEAEL